MGLSTDEKLVAEAEDNEDDPEPDTTSPDDNTPTTFARLADSLVNAAISDEDDSDLDDEATPSLSTVPRRKLICYFGCQELIPLAELFHFEKLDPLEIPDRTPSGRKGKGIDYYWKGAVRNLGRELELYKLLQDIEGTRDDETGQGSSGSTPIVVE